MATSKTTFCHPTVDKILANFPPHIRYLKSKHGMKYVEDWSLVHKEETAWAQKRCDDRDFAVIDTETTGVNTVAEMVELSIIGPYGQALYDGLLRPKSRILATAYQTHGISNADVQGAPQLKDEWREIQNALVKYPVLVIYNRRFDLRILRQSTYIHALREFSVPETVDDLMLRFARWCGLWNPKQHGYRWSKLDSGHRAAGDCRSCIGLIEKMARQKVTVKW